MTHQNIVAGLVMSDIVRERIKARLKELDVSANFVSMKAGLDRSLLGKYLNGKVAELRESNLRAVAKVLQLEPSALRSDAEVVSFTKHSPSQLTDLSNTLDVPIVGIVEAGAFRPVDWFEDIELGVIVNGYDPNFPRIRQFGFKAHGDSMNLAGIADGDEIVCIDPWEAGVEIGDEDLVVVENRLDGGHTRELTVKELAVFDDRYELRPRSTNPRHKPIVLSRNTDLSEDREVRVVGIVTSIVRRRPVRFSARPTTRRA